MSVSRRQQKEEVKKKGGAFPLARPTHPSPFSRASSFVFDLLEVQESSCRAEASRSERIETKRTDASFEKPLEIVVVSLSLLGFPPLLLRPKPNFCIYISKASMYSGPS